MDHFGSELMSLNYIKEKLCLHSTCHNFDVIFMKLVVLGLTGTNQKKIIPSRSNNFVWNF